MRRVHGAVIALLLVVACGKKDKPVETGSAAPVGSSSGSSVAPAIDAAPPDAAVSALTGPGYELAAAAASAPPTGSLVGKDPPTAESLHIEVSYALAKWAANPRDKTLYAKDFGGRNIADGRVEFVGYEEWLKLLPAKPAQLRNPSIKVWLDPGTTITAGEAKVNVSYFADGRDEYRELMWRREDGGWHLYKEQVNSMSGAEKFMDLRNWLDPDAKILGKEVIARLGTENSFAWLVLENPTGAQVVIDIWPNGTCTEVDAPPPNPDDKASVPLGKLTCKDSGAGKDFVLMKAKDRVTLRIMPAGQTAPMSTDHAADVAKGAKVTFKKQTAAP
jgi:hypothetical protein